MITNDFSARRTRQFAGRLLALVALLPALGFGGCSVISEDAVSCVSGHSAQALADAIRRTETTGWTPAKFNAFLEQYVALVPGANAYLADAELAYRAAYAAGNISVPVLEKIARKFDTPAAAAARVN